MQKINILTTDTALVDDKMTCYEHLRRSNHWQEEWEMAPKVRCAFALAEACHWNQTRKYTGIPYIIHPLKVYHILKQVTEDEDILCAGLLHDVVEDTNMTNEAIRCSFGDKIADIVAELTYGNDVPIHSKEALMVKCADILHNTSDNINPGYIQAKINQIFAYNRKVNHNGKK